MLTITQRIEYYWDWMECHALITWDWLFSGPVGALGISRILVRTSLCGTNNLLAWLEQAELICQKIVRLGLVPLYVLKALPCLGCKINKIFNGLFWEVLNSTFRKHLKSLTKDIKCVFIRVYVALELFCYWIFCYIFVLCFRNKQKAKSCNCLCQSKRSTETIITPHQSKVLNSTTKGSYKSKILTQNLPVINEWKYLYKKVTTFQFLLLLQVIWL